MIKKILLENFKAFEHAEIELKPITILAGSNNSGKTSLMQAISLIKETLEGNGGDALEFRGKLNLGDFDTLIHQSSKRKEMRFRFDFEDDMYFDVKIGQIKNGELCIKNFSCNNGMFEYNIEQILKKGKRKEISDYYVAKKTQFNFLHQEKYNILLKNILLNPTFYRDKFFFNIVFHESVDLNQLLNEGYKKHKILHGDMPGYLFDLQRISDGFLNNIKQNFKNTKYIGPIRTIAARSYPMLQFVSDDVGLQGEYAVQFLAKDQTVLAEVAKYFRAMDIADDLYISIDEKYKIFELKLKTKIVEKGVNFADLGSGIAQMLPIIVQSLIAQKESLILIEQPEAHLHPKGQADFADFFIKIASEGKSFLLETHSDYFIERIRYDIMRGLISSENVAIFYIEQDQARKTSIVTEIKIDSKGKYSNLPDGYITNFRLNEIRKMTKELLENL